MVRDHIITEKDVFFKPIVNNCHLRFQGGKKNFIGVILHHLFNVPRPADLILVVKTGGLELGAPFCHHLLRVVLQVWRGNRTDRGGCRGIPDFSEGPGYGDWRPVVPPDGRSSTEALLLVDRTCWGLLSFLYVQHFRIPLCDHRTILHAGDEPIDSGRNSIRAQRKEVGRDFYHTDTS